MTIETIDEEFRKSFVVFLLLTKEGIPILKVVSPERLTVDLDLASAAIYAIKQVSDHTILRSGRLEFRSDDKSVVVGAGQQLISAFLLKQMELKTKEHVKLITKKLKCLIEQLEEDYATVIDCVNNIEKVKCKVMEIFGDVFLEKAEELPSPEELINKPSEYFFKSISRNVFDLYLNSPSFQNFIKKENLEKTVIKNLYNSIDYSFCICLETILKKQHELSSEKLMHLLLFLAKTGLAAIFIDTKKFDIIFSTF